jgi:hypothetical protein
VSTISPTHSSVLTSQVVRSASTAATKAAAPAPAESAVSTPSTVLSLDTMTAVDVVYTKPAPLTQRQAWTSQSRDEVSSLMSVNSARSSAEGLAGRWRGLGSALLNQFASTGTDYRQTLVNYQAAETAGVSTQSLDEAALESFSGKAAKASLKVQTRSGQTVEFIIAVDNSPGRNGLQVEIKSSGPLSSSERNALAKLAQGFDKALEGLGQADKPKMDLASLMDFDASVLKSVDLSIKNPQASQPLSSFNLHLGPERKSIDFKGLLGETALSVDGQTPMGAVDSRQRQSAIDGLLRQFDAAAQRSHADSQLVGMFKDAFSQLHASTASSVASVVTPERQEAASRIQPLLSGLADFEASFSGEFERTGRYGGVIEKGNVDYRLSQQTEVTQTAGAEDLRAEQTQEEQLLGQYMQSRGGVMLDLASGNYDVFTVEDSTRTSTKVETVKGKLSEATRQTEQQLLQTMKKMVNFRAEEERSTPRNKSLVENLL